MIGNVDPSTGAVSGLHVDPNNPYGEFQQMYKSQATEMHHAQDLARARGLTGGYANAGLANLRSQEGGQAAQLGQQMSGDMSDLDAALMQAASDRSYARTNALEEAAQNAIAQQQFTPYVPPAPVAPTPLRKAVAAKPVARPVLNARKALAKRIVTRRRP